MIRVFSWFTVSRDNTGSICGTRDIFKDARLFKRETSAKRCRDVKRVVLKRVEANCGEVGRGEVRGGEVRWGEARRARRVRRGEAVRWGEVKRGRVSLGEMRWGEARWGIVRWGELRWSGVRYSEVRWGFARRDEVRRREGDTLDRRGLGWRNSVRGILDPLSSPMLCPLNPSLPSTVRRMVHKQ